MAKMQQVVQTNSSERRTVVYVGAFELPDRNAAAQRVVANAMIFRDLGYHVVLIGESREATGGAIQKKSYPQLDFECWERPRPAGFAAWAKRTLSAGAIARTVASHHGGSLHSIICYNFPALAQYQLLRLARRLGGFGLADVTEWYGKLRFDGLVSLAKNADTAARMKVVNRLMDGLVTTSEYITRFYAKPGRPLVELPALFHQDALQAPVRMAGPPRLFFAGTGFDPSLVVRSKDGPKDRLDKVLEALDGAKSLGSAFEFDIFGVNQADYLTIFPGHAQLLQRLNGLVHFHSRQPVAIVRARLVAADFSIFLREKTIVTLAGFPTKFSESIHYGTPVITNRIGSLTAYHVEGKTGFFIDYDDRALAARQLANVLARPAAEIAAMKDYCLHSRLFHYQRYNELVQAFFSDLEVSRNVLSR